MLPTTVIGIAWSVAGVLAVAGCGGAATEPKPTPAPNKAAPKPKPPDPVLFLPGERIDWAVSWFDVTAARFSLSVSESESAEGRRAYDVATTAESTGMLSAVAANLRGRALTTIDMDRGAPLYVAGTFDDVYSGAVLRGEHQDIKTPVPWDVQLPGGEIAHDTHSGLGKLRAFRGDPGQSVRYYGRIGGQLWSVDATARQIETVQTAAGQKRARKLDCVISPVTDQLEPSQRDAPYPFEIWISDDEYRVPVRIRVDSRLGGVVVFDMERYRRPESDAR